MELHEEEGGFVYKRLKHQPVEPTVSTALPPDPAAEERNYRERKKKLLLKLKRSYRQEIQDWELLSKALQDRIQTQSQAIVLPDLHVSISLSTEHLLDSAAYGEIAETLLVKVEAQEAFINEVSMLCDVAESLCNAQEQLLLKKQPFACLPIWESSPQKLIELLCEDLENNSMKVKLKLKSLKKT